MRLRAVLASAVFLAIAATQGAAGADLPVDLELVLAVDVSEFDQYRACLSPTGAVTPAR